MKNKRNKEIIKNAQQAILKFTHDKDQFMSLMRETPNFETLCSLIERIQTINLSNESYEPVTLGLYEAILVGSVLSILRDEMHAITIDTDIQNIKSQTKEFG